MIDAARQAELADYAEHIAELLDTAGAYSGDPLAAGWVVCGATLCRDVGDGMVIRLRVSVEED